MRLLLYVFWFACLALISANDASFPYEVSLAYDLYKNGAPVLETSNLNLNDFLKQSTNLDDTAINNIVNSAKSKNLEDAIDDEINKKGSDQKIQINDKNLYSGKIKPYSALYERFIIDSMELRLDTDRISSLNDKVLEGRKSDFKDVLNTLIKQGDATDKSKQMLSLMDKNLDDLDNIKSIENLMQDIKTELVSKYGSGKNLKAKRIKLPNAGHFNIIKDSYGYKSTMFLMRCQL